ncbi:MAG: pilus assembly protein N-terminal domain-containing protein [Magnetospirillum sp.]|nr:pilus assembly protein N-terminal domain-containing protein [Magnetospirillum sp.]
MALAALIRSSLIALATAVAAPAFAAGPAAPIEVPLGGAVLVQVGGAARSVVVGNPAIADVTVDSPRSITLFGKFTGGTTLAVLDANGGVLLNRPVVVTAGGNGSVTIRYGTGKTWVPGGATAIVDCGADSCAPANTIPTADSPYKSKPATK